ncbi:MAG: hypothetical protein VX498_13060 [Myxococcota bacterium]|nr:hypothetical protein [Myxococcota bacterium]
MTVRPLRYTVCLFVLYAFLAAGSTETDGSSYSSPSSSSGSDSAVRACKAECQEGYEKYRDNPAFGGGSGERILRECKAECERNPNW